jgi:HK97 family phage major capsid protein
MSWGVKEIFAEEAACIVVIPENVIDDADIDLWAEVESRTSEAIARLIDQTVFFGTAPAGSVPASFPVGGIVGEATAAGHLYAQGTTDAAEDLAEAWNQTMSLVEADGFNVSNSYSDGSIKGTLRGLRDANGTPIYVTNLAGGGPTQSVYGVPISYVTNGSWDKTKALAVMGDSSMAVLGIRQRLTAKRLTEATVGTFNLAEQDMVGLRVKTRLAFAVLVPKGPGQSATPYPFAVLAPKAGP